MFMGNHEKNEDSMVSCSIVNLILIKASHLSVNINKKSVIPA